MDTSTTPLLGNQRKNFLDRRLFGILGIIVAVLVPSMMGSYQQHIFIMVAFYAFVASSWNLVCGFVGTLSLGHSVYAGIGGYVSTILLMETGLSPWIGMFVGAAITCIIGILVGFPCFRLKGPYFALTSIAFSELVRIWVENNETFLGIEIKGSMGLVLPQSGYSFLAFDFANKLTFYYIILTFLAIVVLVTWIMSRNKLGFYLVAIRSDADAAESLGINLTRYRVIAMAISCFLMGFAGTFYAQYFRYLGPTRIFGHDLSVQIALLALIGGQGTVLGPVFGAILLVPLTEVLSEHFGGTMPGLHLFIYGVVMMLVIRFMPRGIHDYVVKFFNWLNDLIFGKKNTTITRDKS